jgi:hypothetical protein
LKLDEKITLALSLFAGWGLIFFGVFATPLSLSEKFLVDLIDTVFFLAVAIAYISWKNRLHYKAVFYYGKKNYLLFEIVLILIIVGIILYLYSSGFFHHFHFLP